MKKAAVYCNWNKTKLSIVFRYFCLKCLFVEDRNLRRKYAAQNAKNGVSGLQISNIFRGIMPTDQQCFANFRSGGTVLKIKWAWSLDWAWHYA
jgi:hypothetical protein